MKTLQVKIVYLLFTTDAWHNPSTNDILGIFSSKELAIKQAYKTAKLNDDDPLSDDDILNLENIGQTQGRDNNFIIQDFNINESLY